MISNVSICIELNACNLTQLKYLIEKNKFKLDDLKNLLFRVEEIQEELRQMESKLSNGL